MQHMTNVPNAGQPIDVTNYPKFVYICDGEVAHIVRIPPEVEFLIAVMSSNPTVLKVDPNEDIQHGYLYIDGKFVPPDEI